MLIILTMIEIKNIKKYYTKKKLIGSNIVKAVDGVGFSIKKGETYGLVGESGSGKTTIGKIVIGILKPDTGNIYFKNIDIYNSKNNILKTIRTKYQIVFQNPLDSLNPKMNILSILSEGLNINRKDIDLKKEINKLLDCVELPKKTIDKYPHELSGGEKQRIAIARSISVAPEFLILDEPVSALDVSVQSQILNLLRSLQKDLGLTYLFISHDLGVIRYMSDRIGVMYKGKIIEEGRTKTIFGNPKNMYTKKLIHSIPSI